MVTPTCKVFDAPQAYESMSHASIFPDLSLLLKRAEVTGRGLVQVQKAVKAIASASRSLQRHCGDRTVFASKTLAACI
eukprot:9225190-Karenia_brevis.AAC.1